MSESIPGRPLYDHVVELLNRQGKTKTWLAQRAGVSRVTIENWTKQPKPPQSATVLAVADALGIDHDKALRLAGLLPNEPHPLLGPDADLTKVPSDELVAQIGRLAAELRRRIPE